MLLFIISRIKHMVPLVQTLSHWDRNAKSSSKIESDEQTDVIRIVLTIRTDVGTETETEKETGTEKGTGTEIEIEIEIEIGTGTEIETEIETEEIETDAKIEKTKVAEKKMTKEIKARYCEHLY